MSQSKFIRSRKNSIRTPSKRDSIPKGPSFRIDSHRNSRDNSMAKRSAKNIFSRKASRNENKIPTESSMRLRKVSFDKLPKEARIKA
jgi:hypothetical protein